MKEEKAFDWDSYITRVEASGYEFLWTGRCPNCEGAACQIHKNGVVHTKCENEDFDQTGFGGPNVRSWEQAVAYGNLSEEERQAEIARIRKESIEKQARLKSYLTG